MYGLWDSYLGASWHVTKVVAAEESVDGCSLWIAKNLKHKKKNMVQS